MIYCRLKKPGEMETKRQSAMVLSESQLRVEYFIIENESKSKTVTKLPSLD